MKKIVLEFLGNLNFNFYVKIDEKLVDLKRLPNGHKIYEFESEKDELDIEIFKWYEEESKIWWLMGIIFYLISFFGIFDVRKGKTANTLKYKGKIKLLGDHDSYHTFIKVERFLNDNKAFTPSGDQTIIDNDTNRYYVDELVKKRRKKLKKIKTISTILIFVCIGIIVLV